MLILNNLIILSSTNKYVLFSSVKQITMFKSIPAVFHISSFKISRENAILQIPSGLVSELLGQTHWTNLKYLSQGHNGLNYNF